MAGGMFAAPQGEGWALGYKDKGGRNVHITLTRGRGIRREFVTAVGESIKLRNELKSEFLCE
jgi:hypothetical protein